MILPTPFPPVPMGRTDDLNIQILVRPSVRKSLSLVWFRSHNFLVMSPFQLLFNLPTLPPINFPTLPPTIISISQFPHTSSHYIHNFPTVACTITSTSPNFQYYMNFPTLPPIISQLPHTSTHNNLTVFLLQPITSSSYLKQQQQQQRLYIITFHSSSIISVTLKILLLENFSPCTYRFLHRSPTPLQLFSYSTFLVFLVNFQNSAAHNSVADISGKNAMISSSKTLSNH